MKPRLNQIIIAALICLLTLPVIVSGQSTEQLVKDFKWRQIGPPNMSGRIADIEALETDFRYVVVATASGGVYKSVNAGNTWEPIFDDYSTVSVGDVALYQGSGNIIWVGTGEANTRNSIAWGDGVYKSENGGKTFTNVGLKTTGHIKRIATHPTDPDIAFVAAQGPLWGWSGDRGLFVTRDGGKSWDKISNGLPTDSKTGANDVLIDPKDPNIMYSSFWQRIRTPYSFTSGGPNGGIFKSVDGGRTWKKLTNGLPSGDTGKIGLTMFRRDTKIIMAIVEHGYQPENSDPAYNDMSKLGTGIYRSENSGESWKYVNRINNRPFYYSHIRINPVDDQIVYYMDSRFYISFDGGKTFAQKDTKHHGDNHALWADPYRQGRFYLGSDGGAALTHDQGEHFTFFHNIVAAQFYAVGVDMQTPYWIFGGLQDNGTWGGPSRTRDPNGILKDHWIKIGGGDGFHSQIDPTDWKTVYYESQAGNINRKNRVTGQNKRIKPNENNIINYEDYITQDIIDTQKEKGYGDAFRFNWSSPIVISQFDNKTIYFAANHLFKSVDQGDSWKMLSHDLSTNDAVESRRETGGLTSDITGAETHCTIITISESPLNAKVLWVGTDDGNIQLTRDGGQNWTNTASNLKSVPSRLWISRVEASHFDEGTAYVTIDGHRSDNFSTMIYKTTDFGQTWNDISSNLPDGNPLYVVTEDAQNSNLLFTGSEFTSFVTLDGGKSWAKFSNKFPTVAVHDLVIHPREGDLVAGTHGRGIWIADDISPLQQFTDEVRAADSHLFDVKPAMKWQMIMKSDPRMGHLLFSGKNPPNRALISYYINEDAKGSVTLEITSPNSDDRLFRDLTATAGISRFEWDLSFDATQEQRDMFTKQLQRYIDDVSEKVSSKGEQTRIDKIAQKMTTSFTDEDKTELLWELFAEFSDYLPRRPFGRFSLSGKDAEPGEYNVTLTVNGKSMTKSFRVVADPILENQ